MAAIGRRRGIANILGFQFSGFLAWWLWRTVYLYKLPGLRKKIRVGFDWLLDGIFGKDIVQFRIPRILNLHRQFSNAVSTAINDVPRPAA
jgi:NADH:ubiquinone reductase (H+-translocating)